MKVLSDIFKTKENLKSINTNHIFIVDVSGSMSSSLPKMREHIKNNFALLVKPKDTVSIIYFSSKGQYGVVFENQAISSLSDLSALQKSVDKFLKPMGLTGFLEPINESISVVKRIDNGNINNFIFMTDGYDNQWSQDKILNSCQELPKYFQNIVFIEYGYYCNRKLLEQMSSISGGFHVFSEGYEEYEKTVEQILESDLSTNISIDVDGNFVFYFQDNELYSKDVTDGKVVVPEDLEELFILQDFNIKESSFNTYSNKVKYSMLYLAISKMKSNEAWNILRAMGDVDIIEKFSSCFSKQDYSNILKDIKECIFDESKQYKKGINFSLVPKDDAFTIIDLVNILVQDDNKLVIADKAFNYNKIGAKSKELSKEEKLTKLKEKLSKTTDTDQIQEIALEMSSIRDNVSFKINDDDFGVDIRNIVYNESRPNISISTTLHGYVELDDEIVSKYNLPKKFNTSMFRTYTLIKDGIKNVKILPVKLSINTFAKLQSNGILINENYDSNKTYYIDLDLIPIINRNMVKTVKAEEYLKNVFELQKLKAKQKVYKHQLDELYSNNYTKNNFELVYGVDATEYLKSVGITEGGFNPKSTSEKIGDFYYSKELNVKMEGLSSLPSVNSVLKKKKEGKKLNLGDTLIFDVYNSFNPIVDKEVIEKTLKEVKEKISELQFILNRAMYSIIIGQTWFEGFDDIDNTFITLEYNGINFKSKAVLEEKEIKI